MTHFNLLGHREIDNVLNLCEIESLGCDGRGDHHVLLGRLECLDGVLSLFLGCERRGSDGRLDVGMVDVLLEPWIATASTPLSSRYS